MDKEEKRDSRDELKKKLENIDNQLSEQDLKLRKLNAACDNLMSLKSSLDVCTEIFSKSLDPSEKSRFDNLIIDNDADFKRTNSDFEIQTDLVKNRINELNDERDFAIQEYNNRMRNEEDEKKEMRKDD